MKKLSKEYQKLHKLSYHAKTLQGVKALLEWDQETYMPRGAAKFRAEQIKTLAGLIHKEKTGKSFATALDKLIDLETGGVKLNSLPPQQIAALKEWRRDYLRDTALPNTFVEELAKLSAESIFTWDKAKKQNNFSLFLPYLEKMIEMNRKKAEYIGYQDHPYDALLDEFEPRMTKIQVQKLFSPLKKTSQELLGKIQHSKQVKDDFLLTGYNENKQLTFNKILLKLLNYPSDKGRIDVSSHPFSTAINPFDSRITTRVQSNLPISNIRSVLHECGHAFYELGLPVEHYGTPLGQWVSLGIHESQSRWWETRIGMSKPFWKYCLPLFKKHFKGKTDHISLDTFWKAVNKVEPSMIRVEADEVTYPLHIILRFEIEVQLIEGSLAPKDIPDVWNQKMQELLGITPKNDRVGCLQDVHWSMGAFGYFPTYSLGNLYAAHLFEAFEKQYPDWEKDVASGNLAFILEWLGKNVHQHGRRYTGEELLKKATGKAFSSKAFERYIIDKYSTIYGF